MKNIFKTLRKLKCKAIRLHSHGQAKENSVDHIEIEYRRSKPILYSRSIMSQCAIEFPRTNKVVESREDKKFLPSHCGSTFSESPMSPIVDEDASAGLVKLAVIPVHPGVWRGKSLLRKLPCYRQDWHEYCFLLWDLTRITTFLPERDHEA